MLRRVQLMLDDDLDREVAFEARALGISKSEVVRRLLRQRFSPARSANDALREMIGAAGDAQSARVDDVVYGARRRG